MSVHTRQTIHINHPKVLVCHVSRTRYGLVLRVGHAEASVGWSGRRTRARRFDTAGGRSARIDSPGFPGSMAVWMSEGRRATDDGRFDGIMRACRREPATARCSSAYRGASWPRASRGRAPSGSRPLQGRTRTRTIRSATAKASPAISTTRAARARPVRQAYAWHRRSASAGPATPSIPAARAPPTRARPRPRANALSRDAGPVDDKGPSLQARPPVRALRPVARSTKRPASNVWSPTGSYMCVARANGLSSERGQPDGVDRCHHLAQSPIERPLVRRR